MHRDCTARLMECSDLKAVLSWRNHPDVRRFMYTQHEITLKEHTAWFERALQDGSRRLLVVEAPDSPLGFVHISGISDGGVCDWGFYIVPGAPKGTGRRLGRAALVHAFDILEQRKVCGQALDYNHPSIRFHESLAFQREGLLRKHACVAGQHHDVVLFGLLREEWSSRLED